MENYAISNEYISIEVSSHGAELQSIKDSCGREYLWQGDPAFWGRRSPVLFPFVGAVTGGEYRFNDKVYPSSQHGFARDMEFSLVKSTKNSLTFGVRFNENTLAIYPFKFVLYVKYTVIKKRIDIEWKVENHGDGIMYYSIGGHPAFNLPVGESREDCSIVLDRIPGVITGITGSFADEDSNVRENIEISADKRIMLTKDLFKNDALVLENNQVHRISLCDSSKKPYITVIFETPVVGIWSPYKKDCPFVCIEPWYGRCDSNGFSGTLEQRKWGNKITSGSSDLYCWTISID